MRDDTKKKLCAHCGDEVAQKFIIEMSFDDEGTRSGRVDYPSLICRKCRPAFVRTLIELTQGQANQRGGCDATRTH